MLTRKYKNIALAVFKGQSDSAICQANNITPEKLLDCFTDDQFCQYMELLHKKEIMQTRFSLVRHGARAGEQLVSLLDNEKDDIARKAAVDILAKCLEIIKSCREERQEITQNDCEISENKAREMLAILADGMETPDSDDD